ncbi:uncharacterized protein LOC124461688 [Drosophila willistoni]|uniref:uncharacterized protein LOC124461688 n=1 Tax=Drosophila willistoni TaxID=7260 RepID=UPI001F071FBA|nr:uncharacterized protein LOC124461688 [Drosophila willistoni]
MSGVGQLETFDLNHPNKWTTYKQRFELYLLANDVTEEARKKAALLTLAGAPLFELLTSLASPTHVSDLSLSEIYEILNQHLSPCQSEIAAYYQFHKRDQLIDESVANYMAALRTLAVDCKFGAALDRMLRDRFVCGMKDEGLQKSLLAEADLTIQRAMERATSSEAAAHSALAMRNTAESTESIHEVQTNAIRPSRPNQHHQPCDGCGGAHLRKLCPHRNTVCHACHRAGHLQRVCRAVRDPGRKAFNTSSGHASYRGPHKQKPNEEYIIGIVDTSVQYDNKYIPNLPLVVTSSGGSNLLGRNWFMPLGISIEGIHAINAKLSIEATLVKYKDLFSSELGRFRGPSVSLQINTDAIPVRLPARRIPFAIQELYAEELDRLCSQGILVPIEYSDWATPIVPVIKKDGTIRICGDYKSTINKVIKQHGHQIPPMNSLLASVEGGSTFAKIDLAQAYQQLVVDEQSALMQTISPGIFQSCIERILQNASGVLPYFDDIIVMGKSEEELAVRLNEVLSRFHKAGLRLRRDKCQFGVPSVEFLELLCNRELKSYFDKIQLKEITYGKVCDLTNDKQFSIGAPVWVRNYAPGPKWIEGEIVDQTGPISYNVRLHDRRIIKRHFDQLRDRVPPVESTQDTESIELPAEDAVSISDDIPDCPELSEPAPLSPAPVTPRRSSRKRQPPEFFNPSGC